MESWTVMGEMTSWVSSVIIFLPKWRSGGSEKARKGLITGLRSFRESQTES
jgi:hypothetical protein